MIGRRFLFAALVLFLLLNVSAALHAYRFTHFTASGGKKTNPAELGISGKIAAVITGVNNPRPQGSRVPSHPYETLILQSNKRIVCWLIRTPGSRGTVALFHGYGGEKSGMTGPAEEYIRLGFDVLLVDFMGAGASEGNQTTIGYLEAEQVKTCYDYLREHGEGPLYLYGVSMGAAAVLRAVSHYELKPEGVIIECPFATMQDAVAARFRMAGLPSVPLASLLLFWGSVENGFWAFDHNPADYALRVRVPTLLMYGGKDDRVTRAETNKVYENLAGTKRLVVFPQAGHESYLNDYRREWVDAVGSFLAAQTANPLIPPGDY